MTTGGCQVVIAGAGVTGLLAAVRCVQAGHRVTVLDRGPIPNPASSSFDQHRAIRALDPADVAGTRRVAAARGRWLALESLLGSRFFRRVGVVTGWPADRAGAVLAAAAEAGVPAAPVEPEKLPHVRFPAGWVGVLEPDGGVLLAERVLRAATRWLQRRPGVTLLPRREVTGIDATGGRVRLAGGDCLAGDLVLVAAGPWSRELIDRPMVLHRQTMVYLRPPADLVRWWEAAPSAGRVGADGRGWLLPPGAGTLLKISTDAACRQVDAVAAGDDRHWADLVLAASILPDPGRYRVAAVRRCHYLLDAATGGESLVRLGPAVWARVASGGAGFRTAPLVADQVAAALAGQPAGGTEPPPGGTQPPPAAPEPRPGREQMERKEG